MYSKNSNEGVLQVGLESAKDRPYQFQLIRYEPVMSISIGSTISGEITYGNFDYKYVVVNEEGFKSVKSFSFFTRKEIEEIGETMLSEELSLLMMVLLRLSTQV